jgi:hypothetical protein
MKKRPKKKRQTPDQIEAEIYRQIIELALRKVRAQRLKRLSRSWAIT